MAWKNKRYVGIRPWGLEGEAADAGRTSPRGASSRDPTRHRRYHPGAREVQGDSEGWIEWADECHVVGTSERHQWATHGWNRCWANPFSSNTRGVVLGLGGFVDRRLGELACVPRVRHPDLPVLPQGARAHAVVGGVVQGSIALQRERVPRSLLAFRHVAAGGIEVVDVELEGLA